MMANRWLVFGAGVVVGLVAARYLLGQPEGRRVAKRVIKGGFALGEWVSAQAETLREDLADLVAEAREERRRAAVTG